MPESEGQEYIPEPPDDLHHRQLPMTTLDELRVSLFRCHRTDRPYSAVDFNFHTVDDRFNDPMAEYGVLYVGSDPFCAFIETFGASMMAAALDLRLVSESDLARRCICQVSIAPGTPPFRLVNLADGFGLSRLGIDGRISTTKQRSVTWRWSRAFWSHPEQPDGLVYRACHDQQRLSIVLFDRIGKVLSSGHESNVLRDPVVLAQILDFYHVGLDPS